VGRFIRLHPWRLEIVPAVAFLTAVGHLIYYRCSTEALFITRIINQGAGLDYVSLALSWLLAVALFWWLFEIGCNWDWVVTERRKRFNPHPLVLQCQILLWASTVIFGTRFLLQLVGHVKKPEFTIAPTLFTVLLGIAVTAVMELTRQHVPKTESPEPAPPSPISLRDAESVRYEELWKDWRTNGFTLAIAVLYGVPMAFIKEWYPAAIVGAGTIVLFIWLTKGRLILTGRQLTSSLGPIRKSVAISDVSSARVVPWDESLSRPKDFPRGQWHALAATGHRLLEITTKQGHIYRFGMQRPKYVCGLIESMIGASSDTTDADAQ
jgi:hypothetical protein